MFLPKAWQTSLKSGGQNSPPYELEKAPRLRPSSFELTLSNLVNHFFRQILYDFGLLLVFPLFLNDCKVTQTNLMGLVVTCGLVGKKKLGYKIDFCAKNEVKPREIQILPVLKPRRRSIFENAIVWLYFTLFKMIN